MRKFACILLLLAPLAAVAQNPARYDMPSLTTIPAQVPLGSLPNLLAVTNATVAVCQYPAVLSGGMCTNTITTYTDSTLSMACPSTAQLTAPGTSVCISTSGLQGSFGFWYNAATQTHMTYTIKTSWGTFGPYDILPGSVAGGGSGTVTNFSAQSAVSPLFSSAVANPTTTPALSFTLSPFAAHTFYGNSGSGSGTPAASLIGASDWSPNAYAIGGGSAQAQTATFVPPVTSLVPGLEVRWLPIAANTDATPTLNVNGLGAIAVTKLGLTPLATNDITTSAVADAIYDGARWQLQNPQTSSGGAGSLPSGTGMVKVVSGAGALATAGIDYQSPISNGFSASASTPLDVFCHMRDDSDGLWISYSMDGTNWQEAQIAAASLSNSIRDPSCMYVPSQNKFYFVATSNGVSATGIAYWTSTDLQTFTTITYPVVNGSALSVYAPEFFLDPVSGNYYVIAAPSLASNTRVPYIAQFTPSTGTFGTWSPLTLNGTIAGNSLDFFLWYANSKYYLYYADSGSSFSEALSYATSTTLTGTYTQVNTPNTNFLTGAAPVGYQEGPALFPLSNGCTRFIYDKWQTGTPPLYHTYQSDNCDGTLTTWTAAVPTAISKSEHGTVIQLTTNPTAQIVFNLARTKPSNAFNSGLTVNAPSMSDYAAVQINSLLNGTGINSNIPGSFALDADASDAYPYKHSGYIGGCYGTIGGTTCPYASTDLTGELLINQLIVGNNSMTAAGINIFGGTNTTAFCLTPNGGDQVCLDSNGSSFTTGVSDLQDLTKSSNLLDIRQNASQNWLSIPISAGYCTAASAGNGFSGAAGPDTCFWRTAAGTYELGSGNTANANGKLQLAGVTIAGASTGLTINTTGSATGNPFNALQSSLAAGNQTYMGLGVAQSTNNAGYEQFQYAGAGSASNWLGFTINGEPGPNLAIFPNMGVVIGQNTPAVPPANGIAVGNAGQFQVAGNGATSLTASTAATSSANANSPTMSFIGNYWNGTASVADTWNCYDNLSNWSTTPANAVSYLECDYSGGATGGNAFKINNLFAANSVTTANFYISQPSANTPFVFATSQVATSSNNYNSPIMQISTGNIWTGSANLSDQYFLQDVVGTGANPNTALTFSHGTGGTGTHSVSFGSLPVTIATLNGVAQVANITVTLPTAAIAANTCTAAATATMTGVTTASTFTTAFATSPIAVTGWGANGGLVFETWPTANTLNWSVCNQTAASITPGAMTLNVGAK